MNRLGTCDRLIRLTNCPVLPCCSNCMHQQRRRFNFRSAMTKRASTRSICSTSRRWSSGGHVYLGVSSIRSSQDAERLVGRLKSYEKAYLKAALDRGQDVRKDGPSTLTAGQAPALLVANGLPFVGFGFLDNMIMIIAGEYIDQSIGVVFAISTLAAAALGNIISDICGLGLTQYVEYVVNKVGFVRLPQLTPAQAAGGAARWCVNLGRLFGLTIGCLLGMFPLLFYNEKETIKAKLEHEEEEKIEQTSNEEREPTALSS